MSSQYSSTNEIGAAASRLAMRVNPTVVEVRTRGAGAGAGVIWRSDGKVVTNHHVVPHDHPEVVLADGRVLAASVIARDERNDLAVLEVQAQGLQAVTIGNAGALRVGELVVAIGHPFGMRRAVSVGIVSAVPGHDAATGERPLIRADVLLGPGSSGGPLLNSVGEVVGINAMVSGGLALAVPSSLAEELVRAPDATPDIGIAAQLVKLPPAFQTIAGAPDGLGLLILGVASGSPAERAGLVIGDVLLEIDGQMVETINGLGRALSVAQGRRLPLKILRGGDKVLDVQIQPVPDLDRAA